MSESELFECSFDFNLYQDFFLLYPGKSLKSVVLWRESSVQQIEANE